MRLLSGIILGCALTIGAAYVIDHRSTIAGVDPATTTRMVNWDVVSSNWQQFSDRARGEWRRLVSG